MADPQFSTLLPPNATEQERSLEAVTARTVSPEGAWSGVESNSTGVPLPINALWDTDKCPASLLPWLAWAMGVGAWSEDWPESVKREVIRSALDVLRRKGTITSIRRAISSAGFGDATLVEGTIGSTPSASVPGYQPTNLWACYKFALSKPISNAQAAEVRTILSHTAPARCNLAELGFTTASNLYNDVIKHDGSYNYGSA